MSMAKPALSGERHEIRRGDAGYPAALEAIERPPACLRVVGSPAALQEGLAVVGARKATPYGKSCARRFAGLAAARGIAIISGGARGCDAVAHEAALAAGAPTVVFLGGGCDELYPAENAGLFQRVVDAGGAVASEHDWGFKPLPFAFRERNRLIAGLAKATLIVEAGLPSGTFSTADEALAANREVLVVPGAITSANSRGANRLLYQGATPVVDDETFADQLFSLFGCLKQEDARAGVPGVGGAGRGDAGALVRDERARVILEALRAEPLGMEALRSLAAQAGPQDEALTWLMVWLAQAQRDGLIAQYPDGRYGPYLKSAG
ncbi:DNA-processing protein DprA [Adlercreutzia sp. ZJ242]|uniref:DNA-processing protein DprA n=1 Tax=Adlercreutzia sp. ZJ242 TaxID=2709409 RepID=UPI001982087C|nr:DNA-processing protein DprA [Adlercreutzia sp. ZJ242]